MLAKCACQQCGVNIEFDIEQANAFIACPSCGLQTRLLIAKNFFPPKTASEPFTGRQYKTNWWILSVIIFFGLVVAGALTIFSQTKLSEIISGTFSGVGTAGATIIGLILSLFTLYLLIMWTLLPIFVYTLLRDIRDELRIQRKKET